MNKYTELCDFEINKKVAYLFLNDGYYEINSYRQEVMYFRSGSGKGLYRDYDPCNNPADAMPIIIDNKICTAFDVFAEEHDGGNWVASPAYGFANERARSNSLYRAAMELFLLMKDAENEKV